MRTPIIVPFLILLFASSGLAQAIANPQRRDTAVRLMNPVQTKQELVLINDFTGDGRPKAARKHTDRHDGNSAEFRIYELKLAQGKGELGEELLSLSTPDDYCLGIELRDVNGDGFPELLFTTTSRDRLRGNIYVVRYDKEAAAFVTLKPDVPFGILQARYSFVPKTARIPAGLVVDSVIPAAEALFAAPTPVEGQIPQFWLRQEYRVYDQGLALYEGLPLETPYYALSRMLSALASRDLFAAYKYVFTEAAYHVYKQDVQDSFPLLCGKQAGGQFALDEWSLELYHEQRTQGWITFTHIFQDQGRDKRERRILYQAFMRKIYDEWKITSLKKLRES